jgi:hypothetical protein
MLRQTWQKYPLFIDYLHYQQLSKARIYFALFAGKIEQATVKRNKGYELKTLE